MCHALKAGHYVAYVHVVRLPVLVYLHRTSFLVPDATEATKAKMRSEICLQQAVRPTVHVCVVKMLVVVSKVLVEPAR